MELRKEIAKIARDLEKPMLAGKMQARHIFRERLQAVFSTQNMEVSCQGMTRRPRPGR
jgi:hypothetical protein